MAKQELHYFTETLGSAGFCDYTASNIGKLTNFITLYGYPLTVVGGWISTLKKELMAQGETVEMVHHYLDNAPIGLFVPSRAVGFLCRPFYRLDTAHFDAVSYAAQKEGLRSALVHAETHFLAAKKIHDEWEKIYISQMDFEKADSLSDEIAMRILEGQPKGALQGAVCDRFLGAATADGAVDTVENLTEALDKRYFIKGRPGTGKSTMLRKVVRRLTEAGFDTELYHCAFDPNSLDMVIVRTLGVCLFDSTAPHEYFPTKPGDEIVDIYQAAVAPDTDEKYEKELLRIATEYKYKMLEAKKALAHARDIFSRIEAERITMLSESAVEEMRNKVFDLF